MATFVVTNTSDHDPGSLRAALTLSESNADGFNIINFNIPGSGVRTINLLTGLPELTKQVSINGTTDATGSPLIELSGAQAAGGFVSCMNISRNTPQIVSYSIISSLIINRFTGDAIDIIGDGFVQIRNCRIGTNAAGTSITGFANGGDGVFIAATEVEVGGENIGDGNLISGNNRGVAALSASFNINIRQNKIGTNLAGTAGLGNRAEGVVIGEGTTQAFVGGILAFTGNLISGNGAGGITVGTSSDDATAAVTISGNEIGTNAAGTAAIPNMGIGVLVLRDDITIGGKNFAPERPVAGADTSAGVSAVSVLPPLFFGNLISANRSVGVAIISPVKGGYKVVGNYIGSDVNGLNDLSNTTGVFINAQGVVVGGTEIEDLNLISGNGMGGVTIAQAEFAASDNVVQGNIIGADATGMQSLGNDGDGVEINGATKNTISNNLIAFNKTSDFRGHGIDIVGNEASGNRLSENSVFSNGRLGINLSSDGVVTANDPGDADPGANRNQNYPVITSATAVFGGTTIVGSLNSTPNTQFLIELFASAAADPSGFGEGERLITSFPVTTDAGGNATFSDTLFTFIEVGEVITATATSSSTSDTSEFSRAVTVVDSNTSSISGTVFNDLDGDAVKDAGEPGVSGRTIYIDQDDDGVLDASEARMTSGANGLYAFTNLAGGQYILRQVLPSAWMATFPGGTSAHHVGVATGSSWTTIHFGSKQSTTTAGSIAGTVYNDLNGNTIKDAGEPGLASRTVYIDLDNDSIFDANEKSTTTNASGVYTLSNLPAGTFKVREVVPAGWSQTIPLNNLGLSIALAGGQNSTNNNFGVKQSATSAGSIGGFVYNDLDGDGVKDANETGIAGRTVYIDLDNDSILDANEKSTTTNASGQYTLANLSTGTFKVREVVPVGWSQTFPLNNFGFSVALTTGQNAAGKDFFVRQNATSGGTISGFVYNDLDGDGVKDASETGIAGRTVFIDLDNDSTLDANEKSATTNASGQYALTSLGAGTYKVRQIRPSGWSQTFPLNNFGVSVALAAGQNATGKNFFTRPTPAGAGAISGNIFHDFDRDGVKDTGDSGLAGWLVYIDLDNDKILDANESRVIADASGNYALANLGAGTFKVRAVIQSGYVQTTPASGLGHSVALTGGQQVTNKNFGADN